MALMVGDRTVRRITRDEFERMEAAGVFADSPNFELLDGVLVEMEKSPEHVEVGLRLHRWLARGFSEGAFDLHLEDPVAVPDTYSRPLPDLMVQPVGRVWRDHPTSALFAIEVSLSSLQTDLTVKAAKYANAGIDEYWVLDVQRRRLHVFTEPTPDGYAKHEERAAGTIAPKAVAVDPLDLATLFPD